LMEKTEELKGEISMYCSVTASYSFLYDILSEFRLQYPRIEIKLHTGDPAPAINRALSGEEDIAIAARPDKLPAGLAFRTIAVTPLVFIAPLKEAWHSDTANQGKGKTKTDKTNWSDTPMILSEEGLARDRLNAWFKQRHIKPKIYAQVAGHEAIVSMVSLGFGVGLVPKIVVDNSPLVDRVKLLSQQPNLKAYDVGICALEKRLKSPLIKAFWAQLKAPRL